MAQEMTNYTAAVRYNCLDGGEDMEQIVYIDLYFMINLGMDFLCLFLSGRLLSLKISPLRLLSASALGGVYACVSLLAGIGAPLSLALDGGVCLLMCAVAFLRRGEVRQILPNSLVFAAVSVLLGGGMSALFGIFNRIGLDRMLGSEGDTDGLSVWLFLLLALLCGVGAAVGGKRILKRGVRRRCRLELSYCGKTRVLSALCDSGNLLTEPISARPCVIVGLRAAGELLPRDIVAAVEQRSVSLLSQENARRLRVIPLSTVNGHGMAYAFRMDSVRVDSGRGFVEVDALAVFCVEEIKGGAEALVPSELVLN